MIFILLLAITTLAIAGSAAFFSVYGLAQIFSGSFIPVVVMASSLEVGKLVAASFVYRYWHSLSALLKTYLLSAVVVLMILTSVGIFGFLSAAYQKDILPVALNEQRIVLLEQEKVQMEQLKQEQMNRKKQIDDQIAALPNNYVKGRQQLLGDKGYGEEISQLNSSITDYTTRIKNITLEIAEVKGKVMNQQVHIGPITYIAKTFNADTDTATKWMILLIIFVFDPLAVALTIGTNHALAIRKVRPITPSVISSTEPDMNREPELSPEFRDTIEEIYRKKILNEKVRTHNS